MGRKRKWRFMNTSIVIALPKIEDAKKIQSLTDMDSRWRQYAIQGANALASISELDGGVLLCGYHQDMYHRDLLDYRRISFEMLLMASRGGSVRRQHPFYVWNASVAGDLVNAW